MGDGTESFEQGAEQSAQTDQSTGDVNIDADNATVSGDVNAGSEETSTDDAGSDDSAGDDDTSSVDGSDNA